MSEIQCTLCHISSTTKETFNGKDYETIVYTFDLGEKVKIIDGSIYRVVPDGLELIYYCDMESTAKVADNTVRIGAFAFAGSDVVNVVLPYTVRAIGHKAFFDCDNLVSVEILGGVATIGNQAFSQCDSLMSIVLPGSVTSIDNFAFYSCDSLENIVIPESVIRIGDLAFSECGKLERIEIPGGVTSISLSTFYCCRSLTRVEIHDNVTAIGRNAFGDCSGLVEIRFAGTVAQWNAISLGDWWDNNTGNYTIYCTDGEITK